MAIFIGAQFNNALLEYHPPVVKNPHRAGSGCGLGRAARRVAFVFVRRGFRGVGGTAP